MVKTTQRQVLDARQWDDYPTSDLSGALKKTLVDNILLGIRKGHLLLSS